MSDRCMICGRMIEPEVKEVDKNDFWNDEDDFIPKPVKKSSSICQFCEAKLRKEANDTQEPSKPM